jgi:hypothetical protein
MLREANTFQGGGGGGGRRRKKKKGEKEGIKFGRMK